MRSASIGERSPPGSPPWSTTASPQRAYLVFKLRLADHLLADHGDRMVLANSVEGRYPFLDVEVVDLVRQIPPALKVRDFTEKYILKQAAGELLPREIVNREKFGF